jgi:hypothetical protein
LRNSEWESIFREPDSIKPCRTISTLSASRISNSKILSPQVIQFSNLNRIQGFVDNYEAELQDEVIANRKKKLALKAEDLIEKFNHSHIDVFELATLGYIDGVANLRDVTDKDYGDLKVKTETIPKFTNFGTGNFARFNTFGYIMGNRFLSG